MNFWRRLRNPLSSFPDTGPDIPEDVLRRALNGAMRETLIPMTIGMGIIAAFFAASHVLLLPQTYRLPMVVVASLTALFMFGAFVLMRRQKIPPDWVHPVGVLLTLLMLVNPLLHMYLSHDPEQTTYVMLFILGAGFLFLSTVWLFSLLAVIYLAWWLVFQTMPYAADWLGFSYPLIAATALAWLVHAARVRGTRRLERLRLRDARFKVELENVLKATEEAQRSLATSMAVGQSITSILDLDVLLPRVSELIQMRFACSFVGVFLPDDAHEHMVCRAGTGPVGRMLTREEFKLKIGAEGVVGWVAEHKRPARIDDVLSDPRYRRSDEQLNIRSELALPLEMGQTLLGVLDMESEKLAAFKEDDVPFMQLLADQVATALHNASLYQREKNRRRLAENLSQIGRTLSGTLDLAQVFNLILENLSEIVDFDRAGILLRQAESATLIMVASRGFPSGMDRVIVPIRDGDVFEEICRTQQPLSVPDVLMDRPRWMQFTELTSARAWLGLPLIYTNDVLGMLSLARETPTAYKPDEITLAATFASQAAIALHNAHLYDQITRFNQGLETLVQQRTDDLQKAFEQLERLDRAKSDFIGIASHELRTPLTLLKGYTQMLVEHPEIRHNEQLLGMVTGIQTGSARLHEIVESILDVAKIDNSELRLHHQPVFLTRLIEAVCDSLKKYADERSITIRKNIPEDIPAIQADVDGLRKVYYHLIVNAIKYTPDGGTITISGRNLKPHELGMPHGGIETVVSDTGIGIAPQMRDLIFVKFYQTGDLAFHSSGKTKFKGGGPGLGLAIAKGIITAHGGLIWVESPGFDEVACPGSQFHVVLPFQP